MSVIDYAVNSLNKTLFLSDYLKNGSNIDTTNDYSTTATEFNFTNQLSTKVYFISELIITIKNQGELNLNEYADIGNALTNGIRIFFTNGATTYDIVTNNNSIKKTSDFYNYTNKIKVLNNNGSYVISINFDFQKNYSNIKLSQNDKIAVVLNDNFTGINEQTFFINAFSYNTTDIYQ